MSRLFSLPDEVRFCLDRLTEGGFEAYLVGGCVRDSLLGLNLHDYDIATSALPHETKAVFSSCPLIETGLKHGTVTVVINKMPLEITTFRIDGSYSDGRRPDSVVYSKRLEDDAARRDFTMNALYYAPSKGLIDPFGGEADLRNGILRAVGDPKTRFEEDALRLLRAIRFASVYGFAIEEKTEEALFASKELLCHVSSERIQAELTRLLAGQDVKRILVDYVDLLGVVLPELLPMKGFEQKNKYHIYDILTHTAAAVASLRKKTPSLLWATLLHDVGKPLCFSLDHKGFGHFYGHAKESVRLADGILRRMKVSHQVKQEALTLIEKHDDRFPAEGKAVKKRMASLSPALFFNLIEIKRADLLAQSPEYHHEMTGLDEMERIANRILEREACLSLSQLAVKGDDLLAIGYRTGKVMGDALSLLLQKVIDETLPNEKSVLLKEAEKLLSEKSNA